MAGVTSSSAFALAVKNAIAVSKIHAGRHLFVCIHIISSLVMDINVLSALSDRGLETYRSKNVQAISGIITLASARLAPLYTALSGSLTQTGGAYV